MVQVLSTRPAQARPRRRVCGGEASLCQGAWKANFDRTEARLLLGMWSPKQLVIGHFHLQCPLPQSWRRYGYLIVLWPSVCPRELKMVLLPVQLQIFTKFASRHCTAANHAMGTIPFLQWFGSELISTKSRKDIRQGRGSSRRP